MSIALRAKIRHHDAGGRNLFVRLSPSTARRLLLATSSSRNIPVPTLDFIPLVIVIDDFRIYGSYNGGSISDDDVISIPRKLLAPSCNTFDNDTVHVGRLNDIQVADHVEVEPLTVEDWELLQLHASALEEKGWLEQVSVVFRGQIIPLHASNNNEIVQVKVIAMSTSSGEQDEEELSFVKLVEMTEISIRPKPRLQIPSISLRVLPTCDDWSLAMQQMARHASADLVQVPSSSVALVHPATVESIDEQVGGLVVVQSPSKPTGICLQMCPSELIPEKHIAMNRSVRMQLGVSPLRNMVTAKPVESDGNNPVPGSGEGESSVYAELNDTSIPEIATPVYQQAFKWTDMNSGLSLPVVWDGHLQLLPATNHCFESSFQEKLSWFAGSICEEFDLTCLIGLKGSGKTHWSLVLASIMRINKFRSTTYLDCNKLRSGSIAKLGAIVDELLRCFQEAAASAPSVVILDDLDAMIPEAELNAGPDSSVQQQPMNPVLFQQSKVFADTLRMLLEESRSSVHVIVTGATKSFLHRIRPVSAVVKYLELPSLDKSDRKHLLAAMFKHHSLPIDHQQLLHLAKSTEGHRALDLDHVVQRLFGISWTCSKLTSEDLASVLNDFIPLSRQGLIEHSLTSSARWNEDVGGLFEAKKELTSTVLRPIRYKRIYDNLPIRLPRGILLYGPPGVGKTFLIPPLAKECGLALVTCHGPELLDRYIGASEAKVRQLFSRAQAAAPSLLFFDEFDALAPRRGTDTTGVTDRVVNQLLTFLDGVENTTENGRPVYVVAASARPERIDPALLRPGRLEKHVYIGYPETKQEWSEVLEKLAGSNYMLEDEALALIRNGELFEKTKDAMCLSPADLGGVLGTAHLEAVHEAIRMGVVSDDQSEILIKLNHLEEALGVTRPSLSSADRKALEANYRRFRSGASQATPDGLKTALK